MLKSNSKQARENTHNYIIKNFCFDGYDDGATVEPKAFDEIAKFIYNCFKIDYLKGRKYYSELNEFAAWAAGLPSVIDTCYYYNRSAVDDMAALLEETVTEKKKYSESQAEEYLSYLIFCEIKKAVEKA